MKKRRNEFILSLAFGLVSMPCAWAQELPLEKIRLPEGFKIEVYAAGVTNARSMALSPEGTLYVGSMQAGQVYAIPDRDHNGKADQVIILAKDLFSPIGVAVKDGSLYVGEVNRVIRYDDIENRLADPPGPVVINDTFPSETHHGSKVIHFGPDGKLYVPVGAPCNVCKKKEPIFASLNRMNPDGTGLENFASGIRNTVGYDWHPETGELWFTDNGRDWLGDDFPPDELNRARGPGMHFGFPFCHGQNVPDPELGNVINNRCDEFTPTAQDLGAHVASLGMRFYTGDMFPEEYKNQIFIAEHGSWNRSKPIGYRVSLVRLKDNLPASYEIFAEGWLKDDGKPWGRPVDVLVMPDGAMLVSDDFSGTIYRITYKR